MNNEKLVSLIVDEVYKRIQESTKVSKMNLRKKAVVLWGNIDNQFNALRKEYELVAYDENVKECDIIIVSKLCLRGLSNLASGVSISNEERFILKMLMKGKKVYVISEGLEYKRYEKTAPKVLYNKYIEFEKEIKKIGVHVIEDEINILSSNESEIIGEEATINIHRSSTENYTLDLTKKRLISEADLRKPKINGIKTLYISKKSIITPLAKDFIRINRLLVKRV